MKKSYKNFLVYYIGYVAIKKGLKIKSVNPLYRIFGKVNGCFEEINGNKYLSYQWKQRENKKVWRPVD